MSDRSFHLRNNTVICDSDYYTDCEYGEQSISYPSLHYRCEHKRGRECTNKVVLELVNAEMDKHIGPMLNAAKGQLEEIKRLSNLGLLKKR